jgi:hypothetical protein
MSKQIDWEAIAGSHGPGEDGIERLALLFCDRADIAEIMGWPEVNSVMRQVRLGGGIADIVLRHVDGSVSLLEVKRAGLGLRDYCTGIGQLFYQAIMAVSVYQTTDVRMVLVTPGPVPVDVILATAKAHIDILPLPSADEWRTSLREVAAEMAV